jgi:H+/Cl- antiporter ClcA
MPPRSDPDAAVAADLPPARLPQPRLADHSANGRMVLLAAMGIVVGTGGACSAWVLLKLIALVVNLAWYGRISVDPAPIAGGAGGILLVAIPVFGGLIIGCMARFGSEKIRGHGIPEAIEAILYGESRLSPKVALLKPLSSAISIGSGGPFGAEGPIIMTGGAIGSLFAQSFHLTAAERKTLLVAGAAAGMTGIFGTPLAAILLAVEVLLFEWKPRSFVPVVVAVMVSLAWRPLLIGSGPLFAFIGTAPAGAPALGAALLLGLGTGAVASCISATLYAIEDAFHRLPVHWMWWPAIGALVVGLGGLIEPRVLGAGYETIQALLDGSLLLKAIVLLLLVKTIVWLVALGSGTSGGILAPLLIIGGSLGALAGHWLPGSSGFWAMAGMAAMMSAAMREPLTGAIFAVELTGQFASLPLSIVAAGAAYAVAVLLLKRSILTEKISRRGRHISQEYGLDPLEIVQAGQIMTGDPQTLPGSMRIDDAVSFFETARHRSYPIVDGDGSPIGLVSRADALRWRNGALPPATTIGEQLSDRSLPLVHPATPATAVAERMIREEAGRICVVDPADGRLIGIIARRDLLRPRAIKVREEGERARGRGRKRRKADPEAG